MPDISMCNSTACPSRSTCYRNTASGTKPTEYRQAYMDFEAMRLLPYAKDRCSEYWPIGGHIIGMEAPHD